MQRKFSKLLAVLVALVMTLALMPVETLTQKALAKSVDGFPFLLGAAKGGDNQPVPLLDYTLGTNVNTVPLDGTVHDYPLAEAFAQFDTRPDSDHPDGTAYLWVYDDADNVYFVCDWTSDDTIDDGEDFFTVYLDDGRGVKSYTQHTEPVGGDYGVAVFGKTGTVDYDHMWYAIAVPKADLQDNALKVGFELYGTASVSGTIAWNGTAPSAATSGVSADFVIDYNITYNYFPNAVAFLFVYPDDTDWTDFLDYEYMYDGFFSDITWDVPERRYTGDVEVLTFKLFDLGDVTPTQGSTTLSYTFPSAGTYKIGVKLYVTDAAVTAQLSEIEYASQLQTTLVTKVNVTEAAANVAINEANFPDANFRNFLLAQAYGADAQLTPAEIAGITTMYAQNKDIADFTGIGYFTSLQTLFAGNNLNTTFPALPPALEVLDCYVDTLQYDRGSLTQLPALPDTLAWRKPLAYNEPLVEYYFRLASFNEYPVVGVSWLQAVNYAAWRTDRVNEEILVQHGFVAHNPTPSAETYFNTEAPQAAGMYPYVNQ